MYTAFNRTFPSYEEAKQYCIDCDFDHNYIETVKPTATITKDGVWKKGIGKHLELTFTLETTGTDEEVKNDYSNIKAYEFGNLEDTIKRFNLYQKQGWNNIQILTSVKYRNEPIIEDMTACMEFAVGSKYTDALKKENERVKELEEQNALYEGFITKYKAEKQFKAYINDYKTHEKDQEGLYWYEMVLRPLSPFCQPQGHIKYDDSKGRHGIVAYNKPLTDNELSEYELRKWTA